MNTKEALETFEWLVSFHSEGEQKNIQALREWIKGQKEAIGIDEILSKLK